MEGTVEIDVEDVLPSGGIGQDHVGIARDTGIVDQDVDAPNAVVALLEKLDDGRFVGHVALTGPRISAAGRNPATTFCAASSVSCRDRDGCALLGEDLCDASTDAPRTAGDDRDSPIQIPLHRFSDCDTRPFSRSAQREATEAVLIWTSIL